MSQKFTSEAGLAIADIAAQLIQATDQHGLRLTQILNNFDIAFDHVAERLMSVCDIRPSR